MSLSQAEARMLQQLRDDVDRLIGNGRGDSRTAQPRDDGATRVPAAKTAHGFTVGKGVYLDNVDNVWKLINGTTFAYEGYLWGIVSFVLDTNRFTIIANGVVRVPGAVFDAGAPYGFNATGVLSATALRKVVKATLDDAILVEGWLSGAQYTSNMVTQAGHLLAVGNVIRPNGTAWVKSQADTAANSAVGGIIIAVLSPGVFVMATG